MILIRISNLKILVSHVISSTEDLHVLRSLHVRSVHMSCIHVSVRPCLRVCVRGSLSQGLVAVIDSCGETTFAFGASGATVLTCFGLLCDGRASLIDAVRAAIDWKV